MILKNVRGTDAPDKAFRLTGPALPNQAGHRGPGGRERASLVHTAVLCRRPLRLAGFLLCHDAVLGLTRVAGISCCVQSAPLEA